MTLHVIMPIVLQRELASIDECAHGYPFLTQPADRLRSFPAPVWGKLFHSWLEVPSSPTALCSIVCPLILLSLAFAQLSVILFLCIKCCVNVILLVTLHVHHAIDHLYSIHAPLGKLDAV